MTEKVIKDGSETKRAHYNMVTVLVGAGFVLLGIILILIKAASVEYIDEAGILHENFFLLPLGFLSIFCGLIAFLTAGVKAIVHKIRNKE